MQLNVIEEMEQRRSKETKKIRRMRSLLWLPTILIFRPLMRLLDHFGYAGGVMRNINAKISEKFQIEHAFDDYKPTEHDVIVSCYVKSGTNWMMQITHQIATLGQGEFKHVHDVIPWPDGMPGYAIDIAHDDIWQDAPTKLRVIKSHLALDHIPYATKARYICVVRDPKDVAASAYHFIRDTSMGPLMPSVATFLELILSDGFLFGSWAKHTASFWEMRDKENVLFLTYEGMKQNGLETIKQIAQFMDVTLTEEQLALVAEKSSFGYMKGIDYKFFPGQITPWGKPNGKMMRRGKIGDSQSLYNDEQLEKIDLHFRTQLTNMGSDFPYDELYGKAVHVAKTAVSQTPITK